MKFIVKVLKTVAVILITAVVMLIFPIGVIMVFISSLFENTKNNNGRYKDINRNDGR